MAQDTQLNELVRIADNDLPGRKAVFYALRKIRGISFSFANAVCNIAKIDKNKKTGYLSPEEIERIDKVLETGEGIPKWAYNRRKDYESGQDKHILSGNVKYIQDNDKRRLQRIKSRRGLRLSWGLPVRGQRTKSNFRKGSAIGVKRQKAKSGRV